MKKNDDKEAAYKAVIILIALMVIIGLGNDVTDWLDKLTRPKTEIIYNIETYNDF